MRMIYASIDLSINADLRLSSFAGRRDEARRQRISERIQKHQHRPDRRTLFEHFHCFVTFNLL